MARVVDDLRFTARTTAFVGLTFALLAGLEVDTALSPDERREAVLYDWMQRYGLDLMRLYGIHVTARGPHVEAPRGRYPARDARGRGRLFVMNHRSMLDIFVNLAFIEANIVSRADLAGWPVIGYAARRVGTLFVDRGSKRSGAAVISAMSDALERGRGVMVYPEGTTFAGDDVRPFRPGGFLAAQRADAEIVPVAIAYGGQGTSFLEESFVAHYRRVGGARGTPVALAFGEPIAPPHGDVDAVKQLAHERVQALVHRARESLQGA